MAYTTIDKHTDFFNRIKYTGDGSSSRALTGFGHQPDWLWIKRRDGTGHHHINDSVMGATKWRYADLTQGDDTSTQAITYGTDGITWNGGNYDSNTNTDTSNTGDITPYMSQYTNFILTLTGNIVLQDPGDEVAGQSGVFVFIQDGTGSRTLSHADDRYFVAGGTSITLSTAANAKDIVPYFVEADGTIYLGAAQKAFAEA